MGAKNKNIFYIIAVIVIVILIAVFMTRKPAEAPSAPVTEPEPVVTEPTTPEPTEAPDVTEAGEVEYASRGILSDVKCEDGKMSAIITNVLDQEMNIKPNTYETDIKITVDGIISKWFVCDKETLGAGEYTYCSDLLGPDMSARLTNDDRNEVAVWFLSDPKNRGTVSDITCAGSAEQEQIDASYNPE